MLNSTVTQNPHPPKLEQSPLVLLYCKGSETLEEMEERYRLLQEALKKLQERQKTLSHWREED